MKHTTTGLALIVVLTMSPGVQARSIMSEYYRTLQDAHEAAGQYAPEPRPSC